MVNTVIRSKDHSTLNVVFISNLITCILLSFSPPSAISDACFLVSDSRILCHISFAGRVNFAVFFSFKN